MKILLLGEYSGFFKNLKVGFERLGHEVLLVAGGDGWKKIDGADIQLDKRAQGVFRKPLLAFNYLKNLPYMKGFDVVLVINPSFFKKGVGQIVLDYLKKNNGSIYLSACGDDCEYIHFGLNGGFRWWPFMDWPEDYRKDYYQSEFEKRMHSELMSVVEGVIPAAVDYSLAWKNSIYKELVKDTILLPIDIDSIEYQFPNESTPVRFFHGVNREVFKGTSYIREAMGQLKSEFGSEVEVACEGGLPLQEYLRVVSRSHVMLDQCKAYSYSSMNSLYSMAQGKLLMGCIESECQELLSVESPVIRISPDANQIYSQMKKVVLNRAKLTEESIKTRNYVQAHHDSPAIAKKYIEIFDK